MSKIKEMVFSINDSNLRGFSISSRNNLTTYSMIADIDGEEVEIFVVPTKSEVERSVIRERMSKIADVLSSSSMASSLFSGFPGYGLSPSMYNFNSGMNPYGYNPSEHPMNGKYSGDINFNVGSDKSQDSFSKENEEKRECQA